MCAADNMKGFEALPTENISVSGGEFEVFPAENLKLDSEAVWCRMSGKRNRATCEGFNLDFSLSTDIWRELTVFLISMTPVLELRGAIPFGVASGMNVWYAAAISVVGNIIPVPFIILFIRRIFGWMKSNSSFMGGIVRRLEDRAERKSEIVKKYQMLGLCILVAIPLPGTGAWTGALVAAIMELRIKDALIAISAGVVIAGFIVSGASIGVFA